ncbi:Dyp-type peroxidase [Gordonia hydrophobica]|uniref:Dyp-type peroxidase n=1 Tax=Gordonia hydrophobica TaxID=40516 RepID=A0ABZ2U658_9ACTN|nr:Dyp-type peroxidase [Gordonia hydrophobica]MBM7365679.1 putative iron-dependent peroxidase [Gordonia hydrophobica]
MDTGQNIVTDKTPSALFLVLTVNDGGEDAVRDGIEGLDGIVTTVSSRFPDATLTAIIGIGSQAWDRLFSGPRPAELHPFIELTGEVHTAPSTPGDVLLHIKSSRPDLTFEVGRLWTATLGDAVSTVDETHGFRYFDMRDLTGFVDGTENPAGADAVATITVDADTDPDFAGGSYVAVQKYVTDLAAWNALPVPDQEDAFGRSKFENVEMADDVKPTNAHTALTNLPDVDGEAQEILRDNMPFGDVAGDGEKGTYFIAYSKTPEITEVMLRNMFIGDPEGNHDRLLDFTTAITGTQFFAPSAQFLADLPPAPSAADEEPEPEPEPDGSLGIGSLR